MIKINKTLLYEDFLKLIESDEKYFDDMIKIVIDIEEEIFYANAEYHSDMEFEMLNEGYLQKNLFGFNLYYENLEIEFFSLINPPRNRELGFSQGGCIIQSEKIREEIKRILWNKIKQ